MSRRQNAEWTTLEKLVLTQAVFKYGENMWFQVARILKNHELLENQRSSDFYSQKNCSHQYYLLVEQLETEKEASLDDILNEMPVVVRLAKHLHTKRVEEIKNKINSQQDEFNQLAKEISSIKSGKWDERIKETPTPIKRTTSDSNVSAALKKQRLDSPHEVESTAISEKIPSK